MLNKENNVLYFQKKKKNLLKRLKFRILYFQNKSCNELKYSFYDTQKIFCMNRLYSEVLYLFALFSIYKNITLLW